MEGQGDLVIIYPMPCSIYLRGTIGFRGLGLRFYLEGQGDLVSRLIIPITHIVTLIIRIINLLTKSP